MERAADDDRRKASVVGELGDCGAVAVLGGEGASGIEDPRQLLGARGRARTLEEVGKEFNVTRERIRQIEAKALRKLRHPSRSKRLKSFVEN